MPDKPMSWSKPPEMAIDPQKKYSAVLHTSKGDIYLDLFADKAPRTVNNFVFLSRQGFYDGTIFHRVLANFMVQGGDPTRTGTGGPGYRFADEFNSQLAPRSRRRLIDGECWSKYEWIAVLYHARSHPLAG